MRFSLWSNLQLLALGLLLGFSYTGEIVAHGIAHRRELDHHAEHHSRAGTDELNRGEVGELEVPDITHTDLALQYGEGVRARVGMLPAFVSWEPELIVRTVDAVTRASTIDVKIHPRRGPPPRLRAPPTV